MSLLPSFVQNIVVTAQTAQQQKAAESLFEYEIDMSNGQFTGSLVNGRRAVEVWIWKCLMTQRFRFPIYSWMYGSELESYIGRGLTEEYINTDVRLSLTDALLINPEITEIRDFSGVVDGDALKLNFTAVTIFGEVSILEYRIGDHVSGAEYAAREAVDAIRGNVFFFEVVDEHLIVHKNSFVDRSVRFHIDKYGKLIATMTDEFAGKVKLRISETGTMEAEINV